MASISHHQPAIIRTERGLTISGTRVTLYDVMDYVAAQYPLRSRSRLVKPDVESSLLRSAIAEKE